MLLYINNKSLKRRIYRFKRKHIVNHNHNVSNKVAIIYKKT